MWDYALGMYLDFSKPFDTVDHNVLLNKLYNYGIKGIALDWFDNYREQFVTYISDDPLPFIFAYNTSFLYAGKNLDTLTININTELIKIDEWLKCN